MKMCKKFNQPGVKALYPQDEVLGCKLLVHDCVALLRSRRASHFEEVMSVFLNETQSQASSPDGVDLSSIHRACTCSPGGRCTDQTHAPRADTGKVFVRA